MRSTSKSETLRQAERLVNSKAAWLGRRYNLQPADLDDVRQTGLLAALEHISAWDQNVGLATYLSPYVTYAMLDYCEALSSGGMTGRGSGDARLLPLDTPVGVEQPINDLDEPEDILLEEILADDSAMPDRILMAGKLHNALDKLPVRLRNLLSLYYGLTGERSMTLRQIAARNRVSMSRIYRQLTEAEQVLKALI